jgi:hypothetical protein
MFTMDRATFEQKLAGKNPNTLQKIVTAGASRVLYPIYRTADWVASFPAMHRRKEQSSVKPMEKLLGRARSSPSAPPIDLSRRSQNMPTSRMSSNAFGRRRTTRNYSGRHVQDPFRNPVRSVRGSGAPASSSSTRKKKKKKFQRPTVNYTNPSVVINRAMRNRSVPQPLATGSIRYGTSGMSFSQGRKPGCVKMRNSFLIGTLGAYCNTTTGLPWSVIQTGSSFVNQWMVMPQNNFYFDAALADWVRKFDRYEIRTRLRYMPYSPNTAPGNFTFCYLSDSRGGFTAGCGTGDGTLIANAIFPSDVANFTKQKTASVYLKCTTPWASVEPGDDMKYVSAFTYSSQVYPNLMSAGDALYPIQGVWIMSGEGFVNVDADNTFRGYGQLYMDYMIELCEFVGTVSQSTFEPDALTGAMVPTKRTLPRPTVSHGYDVSSLIRKLQAIGIDVDKPLIKQTEEKEKDNKPRLPTAVISRPGSRTG